jgi:pimeloyl-ACP methyl ester carboxylesterase
MIKTLLQKAIPKMYGFYFNLWSFINPSKTGEMALELFSKPRRGRLTAEHEAFLNTARKQKISFEDGLIQLYHWKGDGPTVLLHHGWESNSYRWKYLFPELQKRNYNIIAFDAPAHGASDGSLFTAIKYAECMRMIYDLYPPQIILAHSVGAMAACYRLSHQVPESLKKIVLLGGPNTLEVIMKNYQELLSFNNRVYKALNDEIFKRFGKQIKEFAVQDFVKSIPTLTLFIHSTQDQIVTHESSIQNHEHHPNSQLKITGTGGHSLHTEENTQHLLRFLDE